MSTTKYIFLDIDGVLNHEDWYERLYHMEKNNPKKLFFPLSSFDPECVRRVNYIIKKTGAKLIISSSWRLDKELYSTLEKVGLKPDGCTPILDRARGEEIDAYIKNHPCDNYIIIDDDNDMLPSQSEHFIKTAAGWIDNESLKNNGTGLTEEVMQRAVKILNKNSK